MYRICLFVLLSVLASSSLFSQGNSPLVPPGNPPEHPGLTDRVTALEGEMGVVQTQIIELQEGASGVSGPKVLQLIDGNGEVIGDCPGQSCQILSVQIEEQVVLLRFDPSFGTSPAGGNKEGVALFQTTDCTGPVWILGFALPVSPLRDRRGDSLDDGDLLVPVPAAATTVHPVGVQSYMNLHNSGLHDRNTCNPYPHWAIDIPDEAYLYPFVPMMKESELKARFPLPYTVRLK